MLRRPIETTYICGQVVVDSKQPLGMNRSTGADQLVIHVGFPTSGSNIVKEWSGMARRSHLSEGASISNVHTFLDVGYLANCAAFH